MNKTNSNGPTTDPWRTPFVTGETEGVKSLIWLPILNNILTNCILLDKYDLNQSPPITTHTITLQCVTLT